MKALRKVAERANRAVRLLASRVTVQLVDDSQGVQLAQVSGLADEVRDGVEVFRQYGFTSVPGGPVEGVIVCLGGSRDHAVMIGTEDRKHRLRGLEPGEVAVYHTEGHHIVLKAGGIIEFNATRVVFNCPVEIPDDDITIQGRAFLSHQNSGVQPGSGNSGGVV